MERCKALVKNFETTLENALIKDRSLFSEADAEKIGTHLDPKWVL